MPEELMNLYLEGVDESAALIVAAKRMGCFVSSPKAKCHSWSSDSPSKLESWEVCHGRLGN